MWQVPGQLCHVCVWDLSKASKATLPAQGGEGQVLKAFACKQTGIREIQMGHGLLRRGCTDQLNPGELVWLHAACTPGRMM